MELTYTQVGDYLIPNIAVPDTPKYTLGKYHIFTYPHLCFSFS